MSQSGGAGSMRLVGQVTMLFTDERDSLPYCTFRGQIAYITFRALAPRCVQDAVNPFGMCRGVDGTPVEELDSLQIESKSVIAASRAELISKLERLAPTMTPDCPEP